MEMAVSLVALVLAGSGLALAVSLRAELQRVREVLASTTEQASRASTRADELGRDLAAERAEVGRLQDDLQRALAEVAELRSSTESRPLLLPKATSANLEDLRQQLRAAQQEGLEDEDE